MINPASTRPPDSPPPESDAAGVEGAPDAQRLHAQLAARVEGPSQAVGPVAELSGLLETIRTLCNARAVALLPMAERLDAETCVVTSRGLSAASFVAMVRKFRGDRLIVQPEPEVAPDAYAIGVPIAHEGTAAMWLAALLTVPNPRDLQAFAALLQALSGFVLYREQRLVTADLHSILARTAGLLELFRSVGAELDFTKACRMAVDQVRDYLACSRVVLGLKRRGTLQVRAVSGLAHVDPKSAAHHAVEAAMREAMLAGETIDFTPASVKTEATAAHELLQQESGAARLTTLPLPRGRGALLLEWKVGEGALAVPRLVEASAPFLPMLFDLLERAQPHPLFFPARQLWTRASASRRRVWLAGTAAVLVLLAWPFHAPIKGDCRLAPLVKQVVAAPFQGQLRKSLVQPGDAVVEGQALAEMDNRELQLKEAELRAAQERALKERDRAMSGTTAEGADFATAQVATFQAQSVGEELALVRRKLALLEVKSPLNGVVLSGDLRRAEGQPLQQGQVLFEIAPLEKMLVEIDVPDRDISRVREGLPLSFKLEAFVGGDWRSALTRVHPQSEAREGRNVFVCEAGIENADAGRQLRPGMRGRATIQGDRRPLIWILGHRLWEWIVTTLWW